MTNCLTIAEAAALGEQDGRAGLPARTLATRVAFGAGQDRKCGGLHQPAQVMKAYHDAYERSFVEAPNAELSGAARRADSA